MKLKGVVPMLRVHDLEEAIDFYRDLLGFECISRMEGWATLTRDGIDLMVALPNHHQPFEKPQFTGSFYFHSDDVDALWRELRDKARVVYPVENFEYGMREFAILDNNGYCLQFGQQI